ncbi:serine-type D-Ala-D-Ala carboxypeptidase [Dyella thiooxydans]|uniref:Serine-type D-Ala-D-Ala carboxypeptidase n=1 Tax=Dyella thiooxydans TaxID=445710 RepID=A0A161JJA7_9GAMM|nr:D-alanyl-D-alanine carboxypeptidase family protein [Dyella thiooxydans]AND69769.1 serine-type D-Ala-D-Ala carboxypeptidase [Dyella thiooxydans]
MSVLRFPASSPRAWPAWLARATILALALVGVAHAEETSVIIDGTTGLVLSEHHADDPHAPASLTKMMTMYLAFEALRDGRLKMTDKMRVSAHAAGMEPTKLGLRAGQTITVHDAILGMITKSANDAATVVAERLGKGSEARFVDAMNAQALLLGMSHTHFTNASGLPGGDETTTARDMSRLAMALYRDFPARAKLFATTRFRFRGRLVRGHNHLMAHYPGMDGLKTGYTNAAGYNLASTAVRNGHRLFGVVLGGDTWRARDHRMAELLDRGFADRAREAAVFASAPHPQRHGLAHRVLSALSPIGTAEAETLRPPPLQVAMPPATEPVKAQLAPAR